MLVFGNEPLDLLLKEMAAVVNTRQPNFGRQETFPSWKDLLPTHGLDLGGSIPSKLKMKHYGMVNYRSLRTFAKLRLSDHIILIDCGGDAGIQADAGLASQLGHFGSRDCLY